MRKRAMVMGGIGVNVKLSIKTIMTTGRIENKASFNLVIKLFDIFSPQIYSVYNIILF